MSYKRTQTIKRNQENTGTKPEVQQRDRNHRKESKRHSGAEEHIKLNRECQQQIQSRRRNNL